MSERSKERDSREADLLIVKIRLRWKAIFTRMCAIIRVCYALVGSNPTSANILCEQLSLNIILFCEYWIVNDVWLSDIILLDIISACPVDNKYAHDIIMLRAGIYVSSTYAPSLISLIMF